MNYPDNFTINIPPTDVMFDMVKLEPQFPNQIPQWGCSYHGQPYVEYRKTTYDADEIAENFAKGYWREVSFAEDQEERELMFPFTVRCDEGVNYRITKSDTVGKVDCCDIDNDEWWYGLFSEEGCKQYIKNGTWIVTSVGCASVGPQKAPETPTSASKPLIVSVDSEQLVEVTKRAERLAQAVERVNIALESFQQIIKDFNVSVEVENV